MLRRLRPAKATSFRQRRAQRESILRFGPRKPLIDASFAAPYNEEIRLSCSSCSYPQACSAGESRSAARAEVDPEFAPNRVRHEGEPAEERASDSGTLGRNAALRTHPRGPQRPAHLCVARWPTLRQRTNPPGNRAEQDAEGFCGQVA